MTNNKQIRARRLAGLFVAGLLIGTLLSPASLVAEGWSGGFTLAGVGLSSSGSEDSFLTQTDLQDGISLDDLLLRYDAGDDRATRFTLRASGLGDADPHQQVRLDLQLDRPWSFRFDYDRRESFFRLRETELGLRTDDWRIERWRGEAVWDGWQPARLTLNLRSTRREGIVKRPLRALNELYTVGLDLDEAMEEVSFEIETRDLPVHLVFEQALASYERESSRFAAAATNLGGGDPDLFADAADLREEERDIPTSRLVATYSQGRVEVAGSLLYSPADLTSSGPVFDSFDIDGGRVGNVAFVDQLKADADFDTFAGNLRLGVRLAPHWVLRLEGDYRDSTTDATLVGERILRVTNPLGDVFELPGAVDESTLFDVTDDSQRLTLEWGKGDLTVWGGAFATHRDVRWRFEQGDPGLDTGRDSDGVVLGAAWTRGKVSGSAEYERGDFDDFVFRTDPETVDRLTLRLKADLAKGWDLRLHGRFEEANNPASESSLDRSSDAYGVGVEWSSDDGEAGFGLGLDLLDLSTDTALVLPDGSPGLSRYDLSLLTAGLHGRYKVGRTRFSGSATRLDDSGETWPVESWIARARVGVEVRPDTELALFGEYWSYDEERAALDDYDVTRYGIALSWRFE